MVLKQLLQTFNEQYSLQRRKGNLDVAQKKERDAKSTFDETQIKYKTALKKKAQLKKQLHQRQASQNKSTLNKHEDEDPLTHASHFVQDVLAAIRQTADKRRKQIHSKKNMNQGWDESFAQTIPEDLRTSFWHQMNRRRLTIVLRPTRQRMIQEVQNFAYEARKKQLMNNPAMGDKLKGKSSNNLDIALRVEQLMLLALHPVSSWGRLSSIPSSTAHNRNSSTNASTEAVSWAEPGKY